MKEQRFGFTKYKSTEPITTAYTSRWTAKEYKELKKIALKRGVSINVVLKDVLK